VYSVTPIKKKNHFISHTLGPLYLRKKMKLKKEKKRKIKYLLKIIFWKVHLWC